jgi:hypothetical protein
LSALRDEATSSRIQSKSRFRLSFGPAPPLRTFRERETGLTTHRRCHLRQVREPGCCASYMRPWTT